jgi:hypothetical protein
MDKANRGMLLNSCFEQFFFTLKIMVDQARRDTGFLSNIF